MADRKERFQLLHVLAQADDPRRHLQSCGQFLGVERLGDEIVCPAVKPSNNCPCRPWRSTE